MIYKTHASVLLESHIQDTWHCDYVIDGVFPVRTIACTLDDLVSDHSLIETIRQRLLVQKVNLFLWRARRGFLPCYLQLAMRGLNIPSLLCPLCSVECESTDHALLRCMGAEKVWRIVAKWCGVQGLFLWEILDLDSPEVAALAPRSARAVWEAILVALAWYIWHARNKKVKEGKTWCLLQVISDIQILSFLWISSRRGKQQLSWDNWLLNPLIL